ncbi:MAG: helix-turn-helix domain-containing protein [Acidobacteria bacterium]|nr:helix-turn-helix domain-containing protein [Acidobacteriota bacterium]
MRDRSFRWRPQQALVWWTGGKDSAWALYLLQQDPAWDVLGLISPVNEKNGRALLHGVRDEMLEQQAHSLGLPIQLVPVDWTTSRREREAAYQRALSAARMEGLEFVVFGNLSSDQLRERQSLGAGRAGMEAVFPLWGRDSREHATELAVAGVSSWVCSVDTGSVSAELAGRRYDEAFVDALPRSVDPVGERNEFHTFVEWAPGWHRQVPAAPSQRIEVYDFAFAEMELEEPDEEDLLIGAGVTNDPLPERVDPFDYFDRLARVRRYVDEHLVEHLDANSVADVAAMSTTGFSRFFRQHIGMPFSVWLAHRRVERACRLLREHDYAVGQVGFAAGFHSERTFRRAFHERMGCSPAAYRKRRLGKGADEADAKDSMPAPLCES